MKYIYLFLVPSTLKGLAAKMKFHFHALIWDYKQCAILPSLPCFWYYQEWKHFLAPMQVWCCDVLLTGQSVFLVTAFFCACNAGIEGTERTAPETSLKCLESLNKISDGHYLPEANSSKGCSLKHSVLKLRWLFTITENLDTGKSFEHRKALFLQLWIRFNVKYAFLCMSLGKESSWEVKVRSAAATLVYITNNIIFSNFSFPFRKVKAQ